jgi:hypothetical protein
MRPSFGSNSACNACTTVRGIIVVLLFGSPILGQIVDNPDVRLRHWGDSSAGSEFRVKRLYLAGDWRGVRLDSAMVWGNSKAGQEDWSTDRSAARPLRFTTIEFNEDRGQYFVELLFPSGQLKSTEAAAVFRYRRPDGSKGVFAAAFRFR